jgi:large subunit ribosomal protein L30
MGASERDTGKRADLVKIRQVRSANRRPPNQVATLRALGLGRIGSSVEREESPQLKGQLRVVSHLVEVES